MKKSVLLSITPLALCILLAACGNAAGPDLPQTVIVPANTAEEAFEWIKNNVEDGKSYVISLPGGTQMTPANNDLRYDSKQVTIVLTASKPATLSLDPAEPGYLLSITDNVALILGNNITLKGIDGNHTALVKVGEQGTLRMREGSTISYNNNTSSKPESEPGGAVSLWEDGNFIMEGGTIENNSAPAGGGVWVDKNSTFTMVGGTIQNNKANHATWGTGGGVNISESTVFISGGTIKENTAVWGGGGISLYESECTISGTTLIDGNESGDWGGGGIFATDNSTLTISGGTIQNNKSSSAGGGIDLYESKCILSGGLIYRNEITTGGDPAYMEHGGGIALGTNSTLAMEDGTIKENIVSGSGGGVSVILSSIFTMSGGTIEGNKALPGGIHGELGGGVSVSRGSFTKTGRAVITNNFAAKGKAVYTYDDSTPVFSHKWIDSDIGEEMDVSALWNEDEGKYSYTPADIWLGD